MPNNKDFEVDPLALIPSEPWDYEPDKETFIYRSMPCVILRNAMGCLCGYVGITKQHPWYKMDYNELVVAETNVHGGLTYADEVVYGADNKFQKWVIENIGIHVSFQNKDMWWFGFDCAHGFDVCPKYPRELRLSDATYKDITYVRNECKSLVDQLLKV